MPRYEHEPAAPLAVQIGRWCEHRRDDIGRYTTDSPEDIDTDELTTIWNELNRLHRELGVWVRDMAVELGHRLEDRPDYTHPTLGPVVTNRTSKTVWDGAAVLSGLSTTMVDPDTGQVVSAVPTAVLEAVLPAVKPGKTSSKWNVRGLPANLKKHRTVEVGKPLPYLP